MKKGYDFWKSIIVKNGLIGLDLVKVNKIEDECVVCEQYEIFRKNHKRFIIAIATHHVKELQKMKIIREDIVNMMSGIMPENTALIFKVLPEYGGEANENNILFISQHPYNDILTNFFHQQMADNDFKFDDEFWAISYPNIVFSPNAFSKKMLASSIPERIEAER